MLLLSFVEKFYCGQAVSLTFHTRILSLLDIDSGDNNYTEYVYNTCNNNHVRKLMLQRAIVNTTCEIEDVGTYIITATFLMNKSFDRTAFHYGINLSSTLELKLESE